MINVNKIYGNCLWIFFTKKSRSSSRYEIFIACVRGTTQASCDLRARELKCLDLFPDNP